MLVVVYDSLTGLGKKFAKSLGLQPVSLEKAGGTLYFSQQK